MPFGTEEDSQGTKYWDHRYFADTAFVPRVSHITTAKVIVHLGTCCMTPDEAEEFGNMLVAAAAKAREYGDEFAAKK